MSKLYGGNGGGGRRSARRQSNRTRGGRGYESSRTRNGLTGTRRQHYRTSDGQMIFDVRSSNGGKNGTWNIVPPGNELYEHCPSCMTIPSEYSLPPTECFVAGTTITMKNGPDKNIEDVKVGDEVLSYNVNSKQIEPKLVTELYTQTHDLKDGDITVKVTFDNGTVTHNTIANPFYSKGKGFVAVDEDRCNRVHTWVQETNLGNEIKSLDINDTLYMINDDSGELDEVKVSDIEYVMDEDIRTYDITVDENHTFFANGILTHNSNPSNPPPPDCFAEDSVVELENGNSIPMSELQVGDYVKTINKKGDVEYSEMYGWLHRQDEEADYINIQTTNESLTISSEHLVKVGSKFIAASKVKVGDEVSDGKVLSIVERTAMGKYTPATRNGRIVVDGIDCSCYAHYSHNFCHFIISIIFKPLCYLFPSTVPEWLNEDGINKIASPFEYNKGIGKLITKLGL